jgi:peptide/nickel transport system permease protein
VSETPAAGGVDPVSSERLVHTLEVEEEGPPPSFWRTILSTAEGRVGVFGAIAMLVLVVFGRYFTPYPPNQLGTGPVLEGTTGDHFFGTDQLGRDVLSRFLIGGSTVILVPLAAVTLASVVGGGLGLIAAYRGGLVDTVITRIFDFLLALPALLIVLVLIWGLGTSPVVIILVVAAVFTPRLGRVLRGAAQGVVTQDYIAAAQARGERTSYILVRELLPNTAAIAIANYALFLTYGIVFVSTLSFLGLGAQPPSSDWGLMVAGSTGFITANPWAALAPALGIAGLSLAFMLIGDAVTRHLTRDIDAAMVKL